MQNKVVAHFASGRILKGFTNDFTPAKDVFHVLEHDQPGSRGTPVQREELKALFFVKDFAGDPTHVDLKTFDPTRPAIGRRVRVTFRDGEILVGTTQGYQPGRPGLFLEPADPASNTTRCFIVARATLEIAFL
jgi:hypothetical protein